MQRNNKEKIWEYVLYVRGKKSDLIQLAYRAHDTKGLVWSVSQVRSESPASSMLQLQHKLGRKRRRVLPKNVTGNRPNKNGRVDTRQTKTRKRKGSLSKDL